MWYPGGEGTPEQATPLLEAWTDYVERAGSIKHTLSAHYQNDPIPNGTTKVKTIKPAIAILSLESYLTLAAEHKMTLIAQTRMQPSGDGHNHYAIYKKKGAPAPEILEMSEPLGDTFVGSILLQNVPGHYRTLPRHYNTQILHALKQVGRGESNAAVLISAYQEAVLHRLSSDWAQSLEQVAKSPQLPASPVVLFDEWQEDFPRDPFVETILHMDQDPEAKDLLTELRMTGFIKPDLESYQKLLTLFQ